jgi:Zn-dependent metalloprotease
VKFRTRPTLVGLLVVVLSLVLTLSFPATAGAKPSGAKQIDPALVKKLKDTARGSVTISVDEATKFASFIKAGRNGDLLPGTKAQPQGKAKGFLDRFGAILGVADASDLRQVGATTDALGATHLTYAQRYKGLPVFGGTLKVHVDAAGDLTAVNGTIVPAIDLSTDARLSAREAKSRAIALVKADPPTTSTDAAAKVKADRLRAESSKLLVYRTGLIKGEVGTNELVYHVVVTNGANIRDAVFVHANTGKVINRYSLVDNALHRVLYEQNANTTPIWEEGDAFPGTLNQDQQNIVSFSGDSYHFFNNAFGVDSYDGAGAEMRSVNNDPTIACPNANWNGATTNYCNGVTSDDVVAHEWGHAYTEYTSNLIYQWQPGALNESYSDIWGETVDLINGAGTDAPGAVRSDGACSTHTPEIPIVVINSPASIARICAAGTASFGPPITSSFSVTGNVKLADDGVAPGSDACTAIPAGQLTGLVALVDRGTCGFVVKAKMAQDAGAIAVVVVNNSGTGIQGMAGVDPTVVIPSLMISLPNGNAIKSQLTLGNPVNVTLRVRGGGAAPEDSYRWLIGEDSTAFGGAIRDMWTPTCMGDAGKVTDAEYHCDVSDNGGVHSNSGVPNHGYALLVDGGTYNGVEISSLGLVKAAHIYWRANSVYQTETTKFPDHADALEASCDDLTGVNLQGLSTTSTPAGLSGEIIDAADCAEVSDMIAAIELRTDPDQCNFQPILQPGNPRLCANQKNPSTHYVEDFEDGLAGWTMTNQGVFSGWPGTDWVQNTSAPGGHAGSTAFAEDIDGGDCGGGAGDISGVMRLTSPSIKIPAAAELSPRLTFEHYVATEAGWDGGNIKLSINGGAFVLIPAAAFQFNPYNSTLQTAAAGNTNPLAGEAAFTGTDGGEVHGTWGVSQINLRVAGARAGDTIRVRFDFGMDGCTGIDGWYVDNIKLQSCSTRKNPEAAALPSRETV